MREIKKMNENEIITKSYMQLSNKLSDILIRKPKNWRLKSRILERLIYMHKESFYYLKVDRLPK